MRTFEDSKVQVTNRIETYAPVLYSKAYPYQWVSEVRDAIEREHSYVAAGNNELDWFRDKKNWNLPQAQPFKDGKYYHFFGDSPQNMNGPYMVWHNEQFYVSKYWFDTFWHPVDNRAVLIARK